MWEIGTFCRFERMLELPAKTTQTRSVFKLPSAPCLLIASRLSSRPTPSRTKKGSNMLLTASCRYTILAPSHRAHHCLRRPSGGPAGGYCRSSADPVACGAPRASAAKDRCTFLACGAQLLAELRNCGTAEESLCERAIINLLLSLASPLPSRPLASFLTFSFSNPPSKNDDNGSERPRQHSCFVSFRFVGFMPVAPS